MAGIEEKPGSFTEKPGSFTKKTNQHGSYRLNSFDSGVPTPRGKHDIQVGNHGVCGGGSNLTIHDIRYTVDVRTKGCFGKSEKKEILKGIDGIFRPGMNAILGPTGSGKSSLLDVLAGRKNPNGLSGTMLLDGCPPPENFKCMVGYVVQDDVVMGTLTVRENFYFSASLRLPKTVSKNEREKRVDNVIAELGLQHCADSKVGTEFTRGVSGGERKRCNIGMELIISPPVLFLDEPTTGLDANTANTVLLSLKRLSEDARTIIFSIHQPRYSIFRLFDNLVLLSKGELVYQGPGSESLDFFEDVGYKCEEHNNPPDFFLDVINGDADSTRDGDLERGELKKDSNIHDRLVSAYKGSRWNQQMIGELETVLKEHNARVAKNEVKSLDAVQFATSGFTQFLYCSQRTLRNIIRSPATTLMQVLVNAVFAVIVGAIYWKIDDSCQFGLQNRVGAFFFIIMNMVFANLSAVELFINNRVIFIHENVSGFYRTSAYFLSTVLCDVIPMRLIPSIVFSAIVYFMLGLRNDFEHYAIFFLGLFLVTFAASTVAFCVSALVRVFAIGNLLAALAFVLMMVFSGLLVNLASIPSFLRWLKYFSIFRYSLTALNINELKGMEFIQSEPNSTIICVTGNAYLESQGIDYQTSWDLWVNFVALAAIIVIVLVLAYLRLRFMNKLR